MTTHRARNLRKNSTEAEQRLWRQLRGRRFDAFKFRRQRPVGPYIADFVCMEVDLVIELDGGQHAEATKAHDEQRNIYLGRAGYRVLRFWNNDVMSNIEGVLASIQAALAAGPHPNPLPQAGEGAGKRIAGRQRRMRNARLVAADEGQ